MAVRNWVILVLVVLSLAFSLWQGHGQGAIPEPDIFGPNCAVPGMPETCLPTR